LKSIYNNNNIRMLEGYGGPVNVQEYDKNNIDPTLEACCAREIVSNRKQEVVEKAIRKHDRIAIAERRRRHVLDGLSWGDGCRCCYDPANDGGEYIALIEARQRKCKEVIENNNQKDTTGDIAHTISQQHYEGNNTNNNDNNDDDSDDDSEFDYLLDEDIPGGDFNGQDDGTDIQQGSLLRQMEEERRAELEWQVLYQETLKHHGYGEHRQMHPQRLMTAAFSRRSVSPAVVLHLYDPDLESCGELDLILETIATSGYKGTKFMRANGRSSLLMNADLIQNHILPNVAPDIGKNGGFVTPSDLPALIAVKDGNVVAISHRLYGLGCMSDGTVDARTVENWLYQAGVLLRDPPSYFDLCSIRPEEDALHENMMREKQKQQQQQQNLQHLKEQLFNCGVKGCNKTYHHKHIGIANDEQDGKLLSADDQAPCSPCPPPPQNQE